MSRTSSFTSWPESLICLEFNSRQRIVSCWPEDYLINPLSYWSLKNKITSSISTPSSGLDELTGVDVYEQELDAINRSSIFSPYSNQAIVLPNEFLGSSSVPSDIITPIAIPLPSLLPPHPNKILFYNCYIVNLSVIYTINALNKLVNEKGEEQLDRMLSH